MPTLSNLRREIGFLPFKITHVSKTLYLRLDFGDTGVRTLIFLFRLAKFLIECGSSPLDIFNFHHLIRELILLLVNVGPRKLRFELLHLAVLVAQRLCLGEPNHSEFPDAFEIRDDLLLLQAHALRRCEVLADRVVLFLKLLQLCAPEEELDWRSINAIGLEKEGDTLYFSVELAALRN